MGLFDAIRKQFIEVIEWTEPGDGILAYRFPVADNEIKNGAQLTVRESQVALFIDQGKPGDQFPAGRHQLTTANLPILTKLRSWPYGFTSPFKAEVYFYSLRQQLAQRWGTPAPITVRDKEFGSVQIRMFGIFSYHIADAPLFYREVSGTREMYTTEELNQQLVAQIAGAAAQTFANSGVPFLDMAANQANLSAAMKTAMVDPAKKLGVALDTFVVESVSLPEALQKVLEQKQSMGILGNDMQKFIQFQTAQAIPEAAKNPGGLGGIGAGLAAGMGMGNIMTGAMAGMTGAGGAATPQLKACVACGKGVEVDVQFCRWCGAPQASSCPNCKAVQSGDSAFCAKCGTKLKG
jgi:membrane protease subunit (stomatin/prohibitin family)